MISLLSKAQLWLIGVYQQFRIGRPPVCRYTPSCSAYGAEAIRNLGFVRGNFLLLKRLCRCHPLGGWGEDLVPRRSKA